MSALRGEPPRRFAVALVQMAMGEDAGANLRKGVDGVREAARRGARVVCLPELFRSRYFCQREDTAFFDLAEPLPGPTTDALCAAAREAGVAAPVNAPSPTALRRGSGA